MISVSNSLLRTSSSRLETIGKNRKKESVTMVDANIVVLIGT